MKYPESASRVMRCALAALLLVATTHAYAQEFGCTASAHHMRFACTNDLHDNFYRTTAQCQDNTIFEDACVDDAHADFDDGEEECGVSETPDEAD